MFSRLIFILLFLCLLVSCERTLDFQYKDIEPFLVIEGSLTDREASVRLTMTTPMSEPLDRTLLTDAEVVIEDLSAGETFSLLPVESGVFKSSIEGIAGNSYRLTVTRDGCSYTSEMAMPRKAEIKNFGQNWIKMPYDYVAVLRVDIADAPEYGDCYWVRLFRNGEFYKWNVIEDASSAEGTLITTFMTSREDLEEEDESDVLRPGDTVTVVVNPIDRRLFDYLTAISNDSSGPRLFSGGDCLGYFLASVPSIATMTFSPRE